MKRHLIQCINCPEEWKRQIRATGSEGRNTQNKENENPLEPNVPSENAQNSTDLPQTPLSDGIKENLHTLLAKAVYVTGTPLSMVEHPLWINFFEKLQPQYKLPSRKTISTTILEKTYNSMHRELKEDLMTQKCLHLLLDGWSNYRNEEVTIVENAVKEKILENVDQRIQMCLKPIHYAAYLLDPAEQGAELDQNQN
ncbi:unnamed protein product [Parnassius apollo]|uniref:(apollo) hypothetical protein n=1 Tax=Parnassius apollo TaxID=110799 RepID=A0A8S3WXE1_PARAO|nr:unnamed protein product [Parnassius apollo]